MKYYMYYKSTTGSDDERHTTYNWWWRLWQVTWLTNDRLRWRMMGENVKEIWGSWSKVILVSSTTVEFFSPNRLGLVGTRTSPNCLGPVLGPRKEEIGLVFISSVHGLSENEKCRTGLVLGPSPEVAKTRTGLDFKALLEIEPYISHAFKIDPIKF